VTAVLLDFYGTLAAAARPGDWFDSILADRGYTLDVEINRRWSVVAWDGTTHHEHSVDEATYQAWEDRRWRGLLDDHGVPEAEHDDLVADLRHWRDGFRMVAYEESVEVLTALADGGHRLVVCSNWDWDLDDHLEPTRRSTRKRSRSPASNRRTRSSWATPGTPTSRDPTGWA
jgi:putative hydrolase of the HAD superfamily